MGGGFYQSIAKDFPKELFGPVVLTAKRRRLGYLRFGLFNKVMGVLDFVCVCGLVAVEIAISPMTAPHKMESTTI